MVHQRRFSDYSCTKHKLVAAEAEADDGGLPKAVQGSLIAKRFSLGEKLGAGSFGEVFLGTDLVTNRQVAIKTEPQSAPHRCLSREVTAYRMLAGSNVVPQLLWHGRAGDRNLIVTDLLGPSLDDLFAFCNRKFSLKTTLSLMDQMLKCVEIVHSAGLIHRDLKPDNFLIGLGQKANTVHLIDYGLATSWVDSKTKLHTDYREGRGQVGTLRYISVNAHLGREQSRRDDLESLGYNMLFFLRGSLPWQYAQMFCRGEQERCREIRDQKMSLSIESLCGRFPREIGDYLRYCRKLEFEESPDYAFLRNTLRDLYEDQGWVSDDDFDWKC